MIDYILSPQNSKNGGLGFKPQNMFIFGRSIGTGPASLFANIYNPRALITMSAYTSIDKVAAHVAGKFLSNFVSKHFNNLAEIK